MQLHTEQLLSFVSLVQNGSMGAAAQARNLTQPAISNHLKHLQDNIGVALYRKQGRGVTLTGEGQAFYTYALSVQQALQNAEAFADDMRGLQAGRIGLIASQTIAGSLLPKALVQFQQQSPHIEVFVDSGNSSQVFASIQQYDLGLVESSLPPTVPSCCQVKALGHDHIVVVMRHDHPLTAYSMITLEQLRHEPFIWREPGSGTREVLEQAWLTQYGNLPEVHICLGGVSAVLEAVRQQLGVAVISQFCLPSGETMLTTRPLTPQLYRPMSLLIPAHASPVARKFTEFLLPHLKTRLQP